MPRGAPIGGTVFPGADYSDEETAFLSAMIRWRQKTGNVFPRATDFLHVLKWLGYRQVEPRGKPEELTRRSR